MSVKKIVDWYFVLKGVKHHKKKITFSKEMLIEFIGLPWYEYFFDENDKFNFKSDYVIATARELGKTYVLVAIMIYLAINDPLANFVLTRKYGSAAGSFYEMFNLVLNDFQDKFKISFRIQFTQEVPGTRKKRDGKFLKDDNGEFVYNEPTYKTISEITKLKGRGTSALFSYGKTGDDKLAIFYNRHLDTTQNQIFFLRGADDADGSRGLAVNVGYIVLNLLEEYSQEVDKGKLDPEEQITRYLSLKKSADRYSTKMITKYPDMYEDLRTAQVALANIWDRHHPYNVALLNAIPEKVFRKFVEADPENNFMITVEVNGVKYTRGTSLANLFLYPRGSRKRQELVDEITNFIIPGKDDYKKAEVLGYTFPGFLKNDNPLRHVIELIMDAPEMELDKFKEDHIIDSVEYGADPGLRDAWVCIPSYLSKTKEGSDFKIYINDFFEVNNKKRITNKQDPIPAPFIKQMQMDFWKEDLNNAPPEIRTFLEVNMDMRSTAIRDDFNYDIFVREGINGQCVSIPSQESQGFGLEQRPDELIRIIPYMVFNPVAKHRIITALKTLEPYAEDKKQPHPRKGMIDTYDALCYAIVKHRMYVGGNYDR